MAGLDLQIPEELPDEELCTDKQKGFIRALLSEVGASEFPEDTLQELGKWQASSIIDQLQSFKKQLAGDKPLDESRLSGMDDEDSADTGDSYIILGMVAILAVIILIIWSSV